MNGKDKCGILKEIRQRIADENDIPYQTRECTHEGPCAGTCPRCEGEVRYLEDQLRKRISLGKRVTLTAICAGMALSVSGCGVAEKLNRNPEPTPTPTEEIIELDGEVWLESEETEMPDPDAETKITIPMDFATTGMVDWSDNQG